MGNDQSTLNPSQSPSLSPTSSQFILVENSAGNSGMCLDASGNKYDFVRSPRNSNINDAIVWCQTATAIASKLVGITFVPTSSFTFCLYDNGTIIGDPKSYFNPAGDYYLSSNIGTGAVSDSEVDVIAGYKCYKNIDFGKTSSPTTEGSPSQAPSTDPTNSPTATPSQAPSTNPTNSPTATPSQGPSTNPTSSPTATPSQGPSTSPVSQGCFPIASKVKIQSITGIPLQFFEVQVLSSGTNVALGKIATQSSDYKGRAKFAASRAVDGVSSTFSHTGRSGCMEWWEVDLDGPSPVESIKVMNRFCGGDSSDPNGCLCKLSYAAISLLDEDGKWVESTLMGDTCGMLEVEKVFDASPDYCV